MPSFVRRGRLAGSTGGRQFSLEWGDQSQVRLIRVWHAPLERQAAANASTIAGFHVPDDVDSDSSTVLAFQVVWQAEDGSIMHSPVIGPAPFDAQGVAARPDAETALGPGEVVNGIYVFRSLDRVIGLGVITQSGALPLLGTPVGFRSESTLRSEPAEIGAGLVTGLYGYSNATGIIGLGVRYRVDGVGPSDPPTGPGGRVVRAVDAGKPPSLASPPKAPGEIPPGEPGETANRINPVGSPTPDAMLPNPRHNRLDVRRLDLWDDQLFVHDLEGDTRRFTFRARRSDTEARRLYDEYVGDSQRVRVHLSTADAWVELDGTTFTRPVLPTPAAPDGPTWDNVFSLDHRVDYLAWILRGLDISRMEPFDFQAATGVLQQEVFAAPAPGSRNFHIATNGKATVVPNGWWFMGDVSGGTNARTTSAFSDEESRMTWATSLGISAEGDAAGAKVAYTNNSAAHNALTAASSGKAVSTITEAMEIDHNVVVDLAVVELSDSFRQAVARAAASPTEKALSELVSRFGLFYAYAVTFGSKSWEQRHETEESVADSMTHGTSQNQSVEAGYHSAVGGAQGSVSWGGENEAAGSTKRGTGSDVSSTGSVGTSSEPVPIMLDVEPLTHLLSAVFFDDPAVYVGLRWKFDEFLDEHPDGSFEATPSELSFEIAPPQLDGSWNGQLIRVGGTSAPVEYAYNGVRYPTNGATIPGQAGGAAIMSETGELYLSSPTPIGAEGMTFDMAMKRWWIRGGYRHEIADRALQRILPESFARPGSFDGSADSGTPVTSDGKLLSAPTISREVWWISGGQRHLVPSDAVVEVLGGWQMVAIVTPESLDQFELSQTATSVEAKMIRLATGPEVWAIHERQLFRVRTETGIRKRGGRQQVAVVSASVKDWFADSGLDAL